MCVCVYVCMCVRVYVCTYVCVCMHVYVRVCARVYVCCALLSYANGPTHPVLSEGIYRMIKDERNKEL